MRLQAIREGIGWVGSSPSLTSSSAKPLCRSGGILGDGVVGDPQKSPYNYRKRFIGIYRFGRPNDRKRTAEIRGAPRPNDRGGCDQMAVDNFLKTGLIHRRDRMTVTGKVPGQERPNDRDSDGLVHRLCATE